MIRERVAFALLALVQMSLIAAISLVAVALPWIQGELGLSELQLTLVSAGYGLAFSGLLILGGRLGDLFGPRCTFAAGMALFGLASIWGGLATGIGPLLSARFGQGAGASLAAPAALSLAGALFTDPDRRTRALAAWGGLSAAGAALGMVLSGAIVAWLGWRWVFAPPALTALLALASAAALLPPVSPAPPQRLDIPGSLLVTAGLGAFTYGLLALAGEDRSGAAWAITALGGGLIALFLWVEARAPHPLLPPAFLKPKVRRLALAALVMASAASAATSFFLSLFLQQLRALSPVQTSLYFLPMLLIVPTGALAGRWIRRSGPLRVAAAGLGGAAVSLLFLGLWMSGSAIGAVLPGLLLFPVGLGLTFSGATVASLRDVAVHEQGLAGGVVNTAMEVGPTIGLAALVALSRLQSTALAVGGSPPAEATAGGYASALGAAALLFALLCARFLTARRRFEVGP